MDYDKQLVAQFKALAATFPSLSEFTKELRVETSRNNRFDLTASELVIFGTKKSSESAQPAVNARVAHVFGHWLADLHQGGSADASDAVADVIGSLVVNRLRTPSAT